MQNDLFEEFTKILEGIIDDAVASGNFDIGVETLRAEKFEILARQTIYQHESGAETIALTVEKTDRNHPLSLQGVREFATSEKQGDAVLMVNQQSGRAALRIPTTAALLDDGDILLRYRLIRPMGSERIMHHELAKSQWQEVPVGQFTKAWEKELLEIPEFATSRITIITGLLLPIWKKLPQDNMRVYRLQTSVGERVLGRVVSDFEKVALLKQLGLDADIRLMPAEILEAMMQRAARIELADGLGLKRSLVSGENRLEVTGFVPSDLPKLKNLGCFSEVISWKTRLFILANDKAAIERLIALNPVIGIHGGT